MTPWLSDPDVTLYHGDALAVLRELPDESVHCIATSPPFYALRDYGVEGQIGLEETPDAWAASLVAVFQEARRVLRKDGTLWVECGDSYATSQFTRQGKPRNVPQAPNGYAGVDYTTSRAGAHSAHGFDVGDLKAKDLIGQPWLLAFALRADGWWLRGCNIWAKPNAMPESAKDRCTTAHSYVFHLSKSARYFFDGDAISEPAAWERWGDQTVPKHEGTETAAGWIKPKGKAELQRGRTWEERKADGAPMRHGLDGAAAHGDGGFAVNGAKHPRSVWSIPTQGYPEAHFATWPEALARRIILAGCPEQVCSVCGKARERLIEVESRPNQSDNRGKHDGTLYRTVSGGVWNDRREKRDLGFTDCGHNAYVPGTVLDPFAGSGTTLYVARKLGRRGIGIDLNADYLALAAKRLAQQSLLTEGIT